MLIICLFVFSISVPVYGEIINIKFLKSIIGFDEEFDKPHGMDIFDEKLFVLDTNNSRIQVFTINGIFSYEFSIDTRTAQGIAVTEKRIFVVDTLDRRVLSFSHDGEFIKKWDIDWSRDIDADETFVYVLEPNLGKIRIFNHNGIEIKSIIVGPHPHYINLHEKKIIISGKSTQYQNEDAKIVIIENSSGKKFEISNNQIDYPMKLDLDKYRMNYKKESTKYNLQGTCVHIGSLGGGHYYSICKNNLDDSWGVYNDSSVSKIKEAEVFNNHPYCLFYKRV